MNKIEEIIKQTRRSGNTTWILKSAILNPDCIIVCGRPDLMEKMFKMHLLKSMWYTKLWWKLNGSKIPKFVALNYNFHGINVPVIFDNGALNY